METSFKAGRRARRGCRISLGITLLALRASAQVSPGGAPSAPVPVSQGTTFVVPVPAQRIDVRYNNVLDSLADRIRAIGEYEESLANAYETTMRGHLIYEAAYSAHLDNRVKELATAYARSEMRFQEKERAIERVLEHQLNAVERLRARLLEKPKGPGDLSGGDYLNNMLKMIVNDGFEETLLTTRPIPLNESVLEDIRILLGSSDSPSSQHLRDKGELVLTWDPPLSLQDSSWRAELEQFQKDRAILESALVAGKPPSREDHAAATASLERLARIVDDIKPEAISSNKAKDYILFKELRKFVREQGRQLAFLATGQKVRKPFTGDSVQSLIAYMAMYGYRFGPAPEGGGNSYKAVYDAMHEVLKSIVASKEKEPTP